MLLSENRSGGSQRKQPRGPGRGHVGPNLGVTDFKIFRLWPDWRLCFCRARKTALEGPVEPYGQTSGIKKHGVRGLVLKVRQVWQQVLFALCLLISILT